MASLDVIEFFQALLTTFFLTSIFILVPKLLAALSTTSQSPKFSGYVENLYRHNPFHQWMAERQLARRVSAARLRGLDERTGTFLTKEQYRRLICPNKKWFWLSLIYIFIYVLASVAGAFTIMWQESVETPMKNAEEPLYPGFPVTEGHTKMVVRDNCKYNVVKGSGLPDKVGFVVYQICLDVFEFPRDGKLRRNEIRAVTEIDNETKYWKMTWSLETLTQHGVDEEWRVSPGNEDRLEKARGEKNYLEGCDAECDGLIREKGLGHAMIREALKEAGMVNRRLLHYDPATRKFHENEVLLDRKTRLINAAWISMLAVTVVALLWSVAGLIKSDNETDFAIATRILRSNAENGPTTIDSILRPGVMKQDSGFVWTKRKLPGFVVDKLIARRRKKVSGNVGLSDTKGNWCIKSRDVDVTDAEARVIVLRVAEFAYVTEHRDRARDGMIFVAKRFDEDDDSDNDFGKLFENDSQEEDLPNSRRTSQEE